MVLTLEEIPTSYCPLLLLEGAGEEVEEQKPTSGQAPTSPARARATLWPPGLPSCQERVALQAWVAWPLEVSCSLMVTWGTGVPSIFGS